MSYSSWVSLTGGGYGTHRHAFFRELPVQQTIPFSICSSAQSDTSLKLANCLLAARLQYLVGQGGNVFANGFAQLLLET